MTAEITAAQIRAAELNRRIITSAQLAQQSLYEMCMGFKEMRDSKLYKELGYSNFEDYCEKEVGISRQQVHKYVAVAEKLPEDFVKSTLQIGTEKLYLLATLSEDERVEITDSKDIEDISTRELKKQIQQLKAEKDKAVAEKSAAEAQTAAKDDAISALKRTNKELDEHICKLQDDIKELENRPIETVVETREVIPPDYITRDAYENMVKTYTNQLDDKDKEALEIKRQAYAEKSAVEKELEEAKKQLENGQPADAGEVFKIYMKTAYNALNVLVEYVGEHREFVPKVNALVDSIKKSMEVS